MLSTVNLPSPGYLLSLVAQNKGKLLSADTDRLEEQLEDDLIANSEGKALAPRQLFLLGGIPRVQSGVYAEIRPDSEYFRGAHTPFPVVCFSWDSDHNIFGNGFAYRVSDLFFWSKTAQGDWVRLTG